MKYSQTSNVECFKCSIFAVYSYFVLHFSIPDNFHHIATPRRTHCHNSNNKTFQERGKTAGRGDAIASKGQHFSPLAAILENRRVTLFHRVDMVSERCHNSNNKTFQEGGKTTGRGDAIASKERHFSPLTAILENRL
jgi:hypothetical protein